MRKYIHLSAICAIALNLSANDLGTIQVESSTIDDKFATKKTEVSSTATLSGESVEEFHAENIADVLNTIPGVTVRKNEGDSNKIHIRGVATEVYMGEKPGVAIVIDGVPVQERAGSVNIDINNIESIKVIKGGASYLYGNDALAGAVIITTKRPKSKNEGFATAEVGSYGYRKYLASYNLGTDNFAAYVQASYKKSDGYWEDADYWTKSINGKFQYYIDDTSDITFGADKTKRFENDTGSITYMTYNSGTGEYLNHVEANPISVGETGYATDYDIDLTKLFLTYSKDFGNNSNLMAQIYQYTDETKNQSGTFDSNGDGIRDDHLYESYAKTKQRGFKSEYRMDGNSAAGMLGIDIARNSTDQTSKDRVNTTISSGWSSKTYTVGTLRSDTTSDEDINAVYGEFKYGLTKELTFTLNGRYDNIKYDYSNNKTMENWNKTFNEASYRAGTTYALTPKSTLFASFSTGFRVPTLSQIYAGDLASYGSYVNNLNIDSEKTYNYEIGLRQQVGGLSYEASVFQLTRKDAITKNGGNYVSDPTPGIDISYGNYADMRSRGLELAVNSDKKKELYFVFNYTYLDAKYTRFDSYKLVLTDPVTGPFVAGTYNLSGNYVPRNSKHTLYAELDYKVTPNVLVTVDGTYRSSQYADEINQIKVAGYGLMNLRAKYNTKLAGLELEVFGKIENLFDKQYYMMPRATGDRNDDGLYDYRDMGLTVNPGRTYLAGLSAKF
ncbi:TonB-dependent receptor [Sulfurimonas sp. C5]|uniref:TonB-dependent receptor n=1 Tax=Sulfurimonas sp. C5 TaxID=3036947 RepID=UPI002456D752|nr:TonB-dependent receptor [Sulfurimonas sp. C5]MDH4944131.1 TonB-dependent receptor [Sulfurimonas sp. C5]